MIPPPLNPLIKKYLKTSVISKISSFEDSSIHELRELFNTATKNMQNSASYSNVHVTNSSISTKWGEIATRTYNPNQSENIPTVIFFHGGGFVFGNLDTLDEHCREIAVHTHSKLISIDYPLAPENPFPIPSNTCFEVTCKIAKEIQRKSELNQRLFIAGSSAGATLAAVVAIMCRDQKGPELAGQILMFPMAGINFSTSSHQRHGNDYNLTSNHCKWFYSQYARNSQDYASPYFAPLNSKDLSNLAPALVITAELDPLCDEGRAYAKRLLESGVKTKDISYKGMVHGFSSFPIENLEAKQDLLKKVYLFTN